jgi:hypothetical protein
MESAIPASVAPLADLGSRMSCAGTFELSDASLLRELSPHAGLSAAIQRTINAMSKRPSKDTEVCRR